MTTEPFKDLEGGTWFRYGGGKFMKLKTHTELGNPFTCYNKYSDRPDTMQFNVVDITGGMGMMSDTASCQVIEAPSLVRHAYTADMVVLHTTDWMNSYKTDPGLFQVLLVRRRYEPFKDHWACPGGHVNPDERGMDAAVRETYEETEITHKFIPSNIVSLGIYDDPQRDPRGRYVSAGFASLIIGEIPTTELTHEVVDIQWFNLMQLPIEIAADHRQLIEDGFTKLIVNK